MSDISTGIEKTVSQLLVQLDQYFLRSKIFLSLSTRFLSLEVTLLVTWLGGPQKCQKLPGWQKKDAKREFGIKYIV